MKQNQAIKIATAVGLGLLLLLGFQIILGGNLANLMRESWPTMTPLEMRFETLRIKVEDLPAGWYDGGSQVEEVPGAKARFYWFHNTSARNKSWVNVSQEIILYPDPQAAANAYDKWLAEYTESWASPPGFEFTGQTDQMHVVCLSGYVNELHHYACEALGLYGNTLSVLRGNVFDDRWLTMEDFQAILEAMDRRIVAAAEGTE